MNQKITFLSWLLLAAAPSIVLLGSCTKAGTGGTAEVSAHVAHHGKPIPGAVIWVKFNSDEFPGTDPSLYDQVVTTAVSGHGAGHAHIKGLKHGHYYLYATGFDSSIALPVSGGRGLVIKRKERNSQIELDIPVTE